MEGKRRWKRRGRGGTVQQLFTVVLSSYFTRKHSHSLLNSSSWPVSNSGLQYIPAQRCLLHSLPSILRVSVHPSVVLYLEGNENSLILTVDRGSWSWREFYIPTNYMCLIPLGQKTTENKRFPLVKIVFPCFSLAPYGRNKTCVHIQDLTAI